MMNQNLRKVKDFVVDGEYFVIAKDVEGRYWAINKKDIQNGTLTKVYNGITGHMSNSLAETLRNTWISVKWKPYASENPTEEMWNKFEELCREADRIFCR